MNLAPLQNLLRQALLQIQEAWQTVKFKGAKHFTRAILLAACAVFVAHTLAEISKAKLNSLESRVDTAKANAQYAARYKDLQGRLRAVSSMMPDLKNQDIWLQNVIRDTMKQEGIDFTSISPATQSTVGGYLVWSVKVTCRAGYRKIGSWIARIENSRSLLFVPTLDMAKETASSGIGENDVTVTIETIGVKDAGGNP